MRFSGGHIGEGLRTKIYSQHEVFTVSSTSLFSCEKFYFLKILCLIRIQKSLFFIRAQQFTCLWSSCKTFAHTELVAIYEKCLYQEHDIMARIVRQSYHY